MKSISEDAVKNAVLVFLGKHGWRPTDIKTIHEHGVDIMVRKQNYGRYFCIEVKGDPSPKVVSQRSGREVRFVESLGQLLTRINPDNGYYYGQGGSPTGGAGQTHHTAHIKAFVRYTSVGEWLRHPYRAGTARA